MWVFVACSGVIFTFVLFNVYVVICMCYVHADICQTGVVPVLEKTMCHSLRFIVSGLYFPY